MLKVRKRRQRGAFLVTLALFMFAIVAILALALAFGIVALNKIRMESTLDSAAMSAIQAYLEEPFSGEASSSIRRSPSERAQYALSEARSILSANNKRLITYNGLGTGLLSEDLGILGVSSSVNYIRFGRYVVSPTQPGAGGCASYPCYAWENGAPTDSSTINALQIVVRTVGLKSILSKFSNSVFGSNVSYNDLTTHTATARLDSRCVAFLLDVSRFSALDSHHNTAYREGNQAARPPTITDPENSALFAYSQAAINGYDPAAHNPNAADPATTYERYHWSSLCGSWGCNNTHRVSDYQVVGTQRGNFFIDVRTVAQPLGQLLGALNGVIQEYVRNSLHSDRAFFYAYDSDIRDRVPTTGHLGASNDPRILAQLTNYSNFSNGVTVNSISPNFVSRGWFPTAATAGANLPIAIRRAMTDLEANCPLGERLIVVASSGMMNAGYNSSGNATAFTNFSQYSAFEGQQLLGATSSFTTENRFTGSIVADAIQQNIKISTIYAGSGVQPNFCNRGSPYISPFAAATSGLTANVDVLCATSPNSFFETLDVYNPVGRSDLDACLTSNSPAVCSWVYLGSTTKAGSAILHRRPNYVLNRLAFDTGGKSCALMPLASSNQYDSGSPPSLTSSSRSSGSIQTNSIYNVSPTNFGALCFDQSIEKKRVWLGRGN